MRLDKYLKVSRLIKRRTVAKQACDAGRLEINGKTAKASTEIEVGDILSINLGENPVRVKVVAINEHVGKEQSKDMYEVIV